MSLPHVAESRDNIRAMAGGQLRVTAFGTTSEHLAAAFLSAFAFTTRVRREEDLGHDFHCVLYENDLDEETPRASGVLSAGPPFNVQIKSNRGPILYETAHARRWIGTQQSPFFIIVVTRNELKFDVYSTWNLQNAIQKYGYGGDTDRVARIELAFPGPSEAWEGIGQNPIVDPGANNGTLSVPLGPPIVSANMAAVMNPQEAKNIAAILTQWIAFDRANIFRQATRMHWVYGPENWATGSRLDEGTPVFLSFYVNPRNLYADPDDPHRPTIGENLVWSAWAMKQAIEFHTLQSPMRVIPGVNTQLRSAISQILANGSDLVRYGRSLIELDEFTSFLVPDQSRSADEAMTGDNEAPP